MQLKLGGYIYKWDMKIGLSDHFITKECGPDIFVTGKSYPVTDESFLYNDPLSVIGRGEIKLDDEGVWADIVINSPNTELYRNALFAEDGDKFKLGFMVMNKKEDKETHEITKGYLMGIDVSEIGMHDIEYVRDYDPETSHSVDTAPNKEDTNGN